MGEMAEEAYVQFLLEEVEKEARFNRRVKKPFNKIKSYANRYTEDILNSTNWVNSEGEILVVAHMDKDHTRNILQFLYKSKDRYWLNCRNGKLIEKFENGEDFFQRVIRVSTLWTELIRVLTEDGALDFNFDIAEKG